MAVKLMLAFWNIEKGANSKFLKFASSLVETAFSDELEIIPNEITE